MLQVEDAVLPAGRIQRGEQVTLTFWGGEIDGQIQELAGCPAMVRDGRYVLMVQPGWQTRSRVSPLVGVWHGFFPVVEQYEGSRSVVVDHTGLPLYCLEGAKIIEAAAARRAKGLVQPATLEDFLTTLRADAALIRRTRSQSTPPAAL